MNPVLVVALAAAAAFLPSFAGVFQFDDFSVIVDDPTVRSWPAFFERAGSELRPLLKASYAFNWSLGGGEAGFHALNVAAHALNAALVFLLGKELFPKKSEAALLAALLFAFHPAATEAVTYVSGRSTSLMATFYFGAMLVYLRGGHWAWSTALFACALAVRETAVTLPAALLLCELTLRPRAGWREILRRQWPHWTLLAAAGLFVFLNQRYYEHLAFGYSLRSLGDNLPTQVGGIAYLVSRLVGLHGYNIDPALPTVSEWNLIEALSLVLLAAVGAANFRRRPWIAFGIFWFFLQLLPTNSIVPRVDVANDRQLYLAGWGLFVAVTFSFERIPKAVIAAAAVAVLMPCLSRQLDYASEVRLWESSVRLAPWNARGHGNLGYAYQVEGRLDEARREYLAALFLEPGNRKARANLMLLR